MFVCVCVRAATAQILRGSFDAQLCVRRCQVQLFWTGAPSHPPPAPPSVSLRLTPLPPAPSHQPCRTSQGDGGRCLRDRRRARLRLSSLLPCGSHWKQMVSKQPVMFTAAAIKDKSPTTQSLRRPAGSARGPRKQLPGAAGLLLLKPVICSIPTP